MTIPRYRSRGPIYTTKTLMGQQYVQGQCPAEWGSPPTLLYFPAGKILMKEECWDETHPGPPYKTGGPLFLVRHSAEYSHSEGMDVRRGLYRYCGQLGANGSTSVTGLAYDSYRSGGSTAGSYGAEAWNKFRPVKPSTDLGQWFGELRDLPTNPWPWKVGKIKNYVRDMKNVGGQYLNYVFGWKPFISDLIKVYELSTKLDRKVRWIRENNGKWITRKGTVRDVVSTTVSDVGNIISPSISTWLYFNSKYAHAMCTKTISDKIWFKARCKFYIDDLKTDRADSVWSSRLLRKLYGFELTPALAWELIPFTWLQDWVINIGDVISNMSNSAYDNLVKKYAYVMRTRSTKLFYMATCDMATNRPHCYEPQPGLYLWYNYPPVFCQQTVHPSLTVVAECKERAAASEFGFGGGGILEQGLTDRQKSILLALGISSLA